jgi:hypothetical protein
MKLVCLLLIKIGNVGYKVNICDLHKKNSIMEELTVLEQRKNSGTDLDLGTVFLRYPILLQALFSIRMSHV